MQVSAPNNVKIYNLSSGKSLPDWLSDRKKRALLKKSADLRRRIELIQDFEMPAVSSTIRLSSDGRYILATGIYKPRMRCYEVDNLAMKFERCFDAEVVTFEILSEDYSKVVFLQCDRYIELHTAEGKYYRLRMPKFGHDMKYHDATCDLYLVGASSEIYRLNLERGQFQTSLVSQCSNDINKVVINPVHGLVVTGGNEGKLEAWDPRSGSCVASLDCAMSAVSETDNVNEIPAVTALNFNGSLTYGVGLSTGQVLLYDIRANKPFIVKDHMYGWPIKDVEFIGDKVLSLDLSIVKIWNKENGKLFTSIDAGDKTQYNNLCVVPNSGMFFIANESPKIQTYYIPNLGPAPRWCGFLDALTEELEENSKEIAYDDYMFVTRNQLEELGLTHLIGTDLLRAYMHGYFMDVRLYRKAKSAAEPFNFEQYKKKKIKEKLDEEKSNRVKIQKTLPAVNKSLALKLIEEEKSAKKKRAIEAKSLLKDERFSALFKDPEFEVDPTAEEYRLLNPVLKKLDEKRQNIQKMIPHMFDELQEEEVKSTSSSSSEDSSDEEEPESEPEQPKKEAPKKPNKNSTDDKVQKIMAKNKPAKTPTSSVTKFYELKTGRELALLDGNNVENIEDATKKPLGERIQEEGDTAVEMTSFGNRTYSYTPSGNKDHQKRMVELEKHKKERKRLVRPGPANLRKSKFYLGPRNRKF
ncbi:nucleolar protein 10 [Planococcus citri]|uniref:nucleolar protein 10 n=1 Tax=Planococcus citri TaxID=170843 RepID=UPI0031F9C144